jgi:type I restriction enzyme M protein
MRQELIEHQKILAVVSLPSGVFMPYSNVKTSFIIFQKTNCGGGEKIWFASMKNDGFSLDARRAPIDKNDIASIEKDYFDRVGQKNKTRFDDSFLVSIDEIKACDYDLSFNKYKKAQKKQEFFRPVNEIISDIDEINKTAEADTEELKKAIKEFGR